MTENSQTKNHRGKIHRRKIHRQGKLTKKDRKFIENSQKKDRKFIQGIQFDRKMLDWGVWRILVKIPILEPYSKNAPLHCTTAFDSARPFVNVPIILF